MSDTAPPTLAADGMRELFEEAPCGYLSTRADGMIETANQTFAALSGYAAESLCGRRFPTLLTAASALLYETYCLPLLRLQGFINEVALDVQTSAGKLLPILLCATVKRSDDGTMIAYRIVIMNAPKRREYERELVRARTTAEEAAEQLRLLREQAERKVAEQAQLLDAVARMAGGDLQTPIAVNSDGELSGLAHGLERLRTDILAQIEVLTERNSEIQKLNRELRHQIEQRSMLLADSLMSRIGGASDPESVEILPVLAQGTVLAERYRIDGILGQGGMATVYEVERLSDNRHFAAKVLGVRPNSQALARFAREAQLLSRLQHPNLIDIIDTDVTVDRVAYIVMELLRGKSLAEHAARYGELSFILPVLRQIIDALCAVHAADVVHRDLKPSNVLIAPNVDGAPELAKLVDFGISRLLDPTGGAAHATPTPEPTERAPVTAVFRDEPTLAPLAGAALPTLSGPNAFDQTLVPDTAARIFVAGKRPSTTPGATQQQPKRGRSSDELTQLGALLGTPSYMAPELVAGSKLARPASDIFSFGVLAYEVLTRQLPFAEPPLLEAIRAGGRLSFVPLTSLCQGLDPELASHLESCLAVDPLARPTAATLRSVIERVRLPIDARAVASTDAGPRREAQTRDRH